MNSFEFERNEDGLREALNAIGRQHGDNIAAIYERLRAEHHGKPPAEIDPEVREAFTGCGLQEATLIAWIQQIANDEPMGPLNIEIR